MEQEDKTRLTLVVPAGALSVAPQIWLQEGSFLPAATCPRTINSVSAAAA